MVYCTHAVTTAGWSFGYCYRHGQLLVHVEISSDRSRYEISQCNGLRELLFPSRGRMGIGRSSSVAWATGTVFGNIFGKICSLISWLNGRRKTLRPRGEGPRERSRAMSLNKNCLPISWSNGCWGFQPRGESHGIYQLPPSPHHNHQPRRPRVVNAVPRKQASGASRQKDPTRIFRFVGPGSPAT